MKILCYKKLSNFVQTLKFLDKVSGKIMLKFQPNCTTFIWIKFCSKINGENYDTPFASQFLY